MQIYKEVAAIESGLTVRGTIKRLFDWSTLSGGVQRTMDYVGIGTLVVGVVVLVVAVLTLRNAQRSVQLAETRQEYLIEERERMELMREEHKWLQEELEHKRQEAQTLQEALKKEQQERLQAQRRAEHAEQEALRTATLRLRKQMDNYLNELEGTGEIAIRRVK